MLPSLLPSNKIHIKEHAQMECFLGYLENLQLFHLRGTMTLTFISIVMRWWGTGLLWLEDQMKYVHKTGFSNPDAEETFRVALAGNPLSEITKKHEIQHVHFLSEPISCKYWVRSSSNSRHWTLIHKSTEKAEWESLILHTTVLRLTPRVSNPTKTCQAGGRENS